MVIKDDGNSVYLDFGKTKSYEWEACFEEGFITQEQYDECVRRQEELDKQPF